MRRIGTASRRARLAERRPPRPRWLDPLRRTAAAASIPLLIAVGGYLAVRLGYTAALRSWLAREVRRTGQAAGLEVREILTEGRRRTPVAQLTQTLAPYEGVYILEVDLEEVYERVERLPWVRRAIVRRLLPSTLLVEIQEHRPAALWQGPEGLRLIDREGEVIPIRDLRPFRRLPLLQGAGAPEHVAELYRMLALEPDLGRRVTGAVWIGGRRWNLYFDGRTEVRLPEEGAEAAWRRLARAERKERLLERVVDAIDLRREGWIVLRVNGEAQKKPGRKEA